SAQVLGHTARRVQGRRIGVVFAASTAHPLPEALAGLPDLELPPLGLDEARALLTRPSLSSADIPDGVVAELLQRCAGNPLVLREFAEFLDDNQLCGRQPLPRQLVLGPRSLEVFRRSWAAFPGRARVGCFREWGVTELSEPWAEPPWWLRDFRGSPAATSLAAAHRLPASWAPGPGPWRWFARRGRRFPSAAAVGCCCSAWARTPSRCAC